MQGPRAEMGDGGEEAAPTSDSFMEPGLLFCEHPGGRGWSPHTSTSPLPPPLPPAPAGARLSPSSCGARDSARASPHADRGCGPSPPPALLDGPHARGWVAERWAEEERVGRRAPAATAAGTGRGSPSAVGDSCGDWMRMPICGRGAQAGAHAQGAAQAPHAAHAPPSHRGADGAARSASAAGQDAWDGWEEDRQKSCKDWMGQVSQLRHTAPVCVRAHVVGWEVRCRPRSARRSAPLQCTPASGVCRGARGHVALPYRRRDSRSARAAPD